MLASPTPPQNNSVCLIVLVHEYDEPLKQCLRSAIPFIDHWVFIDFSGEQALPSDLSALLDQRRGERVVEQYGGYAGALNRALVTAQAHADYALILESDEQLCMLSDKLIDDAEPSIFNLQLKRNGYAEWSPRLLPLNHQLRFKNSLSLRLSDNLSRRELALSSAFITAPQRANWRRKLAPQEQKLAAQLVQQAPNDAELKLDLARLELRRNELQAATDLLEQLRTMDTRANVQWLVNYLLSNINIASTGALRADKSQATGTSEPRYQTAQRLIQRCIEIDPSRAEPYMRQIALLKHAGKLRQARQSCELIVDVGEPILVNYLEPSIYQYLARLELADICYQLEDIAACRKAAGKIKSAADIPAAAARKIAYLSHAKQQTDPIARVQSIRDLQASQ